MCPQRTFRAPSQLMLSDRVRFVMAAVGSDGNQPEIRSLPNNSRNVRVKESKDSSL